MGIGYVCNAVPDHPARNIKIILDTLRRLNMLSPRQDTPAEQIRRSIAACEAEARHAREEAESALARAQEAEATANAYEQTAREWRRILGILDDHAKSTRTVKVKLEADVSDYIAGMERAAEATRQAAGEARRYTQGGVHDFAEPDTGWEAFIGRKLCTCGPNEGCADCPTR